MRRLLIAIGWIGGGALAYLCLRPNVVFLRALGFDRATPLAGEGALQTALGNHLPDLCWCLAAFTIARYLRERQAPAIYPAALMVLPLASELAQALGWIPGTGDGIDLLLYGSAWWLYFGKEMVNMRRLGQHVLGTGLVLSFVLAVIGSGSGPRIKYETGVFHLPPQPQDEVWTKPALTEILGRKSSHAIVLRVPASSEKITEEQVQKNSLIYSTIEKELAKAGYTVRDRQLFSKVLEQESLDYSKIGVLTETDLILELVRFREQTYYRDQYTADGGGSKTLPRAMSFTGALIEFKLTGVKENDIVGTMVFHYSPCVDGCTRSFSPSLSGSADAPLNIDAVSKEFAQRLVAQLQKIK